MLKDEWLEIQFHGYHNVIPAAKWYLCLKATYHELQITVINKFSRAIVTALLMKQTEFRE